MANTMARPWDSVPHVEPIVVQKIKMKIYNSEVFNTHHAAAWVDASHRPMLLLDRITTWSMRRIDP
jgi:hypothetical protein